MLPAPTSPDGSDRAFAVGYSVLGPVLSIFVRLVLERAHEDRVRKLAFVARDADLPLEIARVLVAQWASGKRHDAPTLTYVYLSRRSVACATPDIYRLTDDPIRIERVFGMVRS